MDSPFCWATECEYNPDLDAETTEEIARALTDDMFGALIRGENIESDRTGEMALTDPDGNYWFEREQVVEELFALIESRKERDRFKDWYAAVKPLNIGSEVVNNSNTNSPERRNQRRLDDF